MLFYQQEDSGKESRIAGGVAVGVYVIAMVLLFLLVNITTVHDPLGEGLMMNFGNTEEAASGGDLAMTEEVTEQTSVQRPAGASESDFLTSNQPDAPEVAVQRPQNNQQKPTPEPAPQRTVNQNALFPGRTVGSTETSDGTGQGAGNQGNPNGSPGGSHSGTGTGNSGGSASVSGRTLVGSLPKPDYGAREEGRVIVNITVDRQGKVTAASFKSVGSTTQNSTLVDAALRAARQARFDVNENAAMSQSGTITYNFKMQ